MSLLTFLFLLFVIFVLPKIIRGFLIVHRVRRQARQLFDQMYGASQQTSPEPKRRKPGWSAPIPRRKKIDPTVGEYVKFQEIQTEETIQQQSEPDGTKSTSATIEQQVTDAEWEEI